MANKCLLLMALVAIGCGRDESSQPPSPSVVLVEEKKKEPDNKKEPAKKAESFEAFQRRFEDAVRDQVAPVGDSGWVRRSFKVGPATVYFFKPETELTYQKKNGNTEVFESALCKTKDEASKAPLAKVPSEYISFRVYLTTNNDGRWIATRFEKLMRAEPRHMDRASLPPEDPVHTLWTVLQKLSQQ